MKKPRELRVNKGVVQQMVADHLGIIKKGYSCYENDRRNHESETLTKPAEYFDVKTGYLPGEDVAVRVGNNDATLKRFKKMGNGIAMMLFNPVYQPYIFSEEEIVKLPVEIIGVVVESRRTMDPANKH
ncbi:MAG: helix-turn-helix domain-containing protein [Chloroflexi bacterium]|nr:helix-turn-helix domain-containing protein [Chloroflexota bacterium]